MSLSALVWIPGALANLQGVEEPAAPDSSEVYKRVYNGWKWWHVYCYRCHGAHAVGTLLAPNLTDRPIAYERFLQLVRDGIPEQGMQAWNELLDDKQITDLYIYVRGKN